LARKNRILKLISKLKLKCDCGFHEIEIEKYANMIWIFFYKLNEKDRRRKKKIEADILLKKEDVDKLVEFLNEWR